MLPPASQSVDDRIFNECSEDKDETGGHPNVNGFRDGTGWQAPHQSGALRRDRQDGQDAEGGSGRSRLWVDPEGQPGQKDDEEARNIGVEDVGLKASSQVEVGSQTWKTGLA